MLAEVLEWAARQTVVMEDIKGDRSMSVPAPSKLRTKGALDEG